MQRPIFVGLLSVEERLALQNLAPTSNLLERGRIEIVLRSAEGATAAEIARHIGWTPRAVRRVIRRYNVDGVAGLYDKRRNNPGRRPIVTAEWQEQLLLIVDDSPAAHGFPVSKWTAKLLAAYLTDLCRIAVTEERVRHYLHLYGYQYIGGAWRRPHDAATPKVSMSPLDESGDNRLSSSVVSAPRLVQELRHDDDGPT